MDSSPRNAQRPADAGASGDLKPAESSNGGHRAEDVSDPAFAQSCLLACDGRLARLAIEAWSLRFGTHDLGFVAHTGVLPALQRLISTENFDPKPTEVPVSPPSPPVPTMEDIRANVERMVAAAIGRADRGRPSSTKDTSRI